MYDVDNLAVFAENVEIENLPQMAGY